MTRKKPWNRIDLPVYSISSSDGKGNHNMHIITYTTAISMQPKQFICGVYRGTQTLQNLQMNPHFILQLLSSEQYSLVDLLGKKSGKSINKIAKLEKRKLVEDWKGFKVLSSCLAVMEMSILSTIHSGSNTVGDHEIFLCELLAYKNISAGEALTLNILRDRKMIRM